MPFLQDSLPDPTRYELLSPPPRCQTAYESAGQMPPWPVISDGATGVIDQKSLHVDLHRFKKEDLALPSKTPHPWRPECFLSVSASQWAAAIAWDSKHRSVGFPSVAPGSGTFYAGLQHYQRNELGQAIAVWERVRLAALTRAVVQDSWRYRFLGVLCSHIALAHAQLMDQAPLKTRGSEPANIRQGPHGSISAPADPKPVQFFEKTVRWHLTDLTLDAEKPEYDEPIKLKRGQQPPPKPRIGVSMLPALTNLRIPKEQVSEFPCDEQSTLRETGQSLLAGDQEAKLREMRQLQTKIDDLSCKAKECLMGNRLIQACKVLHSLAELYRKGTQLDAALNCAKEEEKIARRTGVPVLQAHALLSIMHVQFAQLKYEKAAHTGEKALGKALVSDAQITQWKIYLMLAKTYHQLAPETHAPPRSEDEIEGEFLERYRKTFAVNEQRKKQQPKKPIKLQETQSTGPLELEPEQNAIAKQTFHQLDVDRSKQLTETKRKPGTRVTRPANCRVKGRTSQRLFIQKQREVLTLHSSRRKLSKTQPIPTWEGIAEFIGESTIDLEECLDSPTTDCELVCPSDSEAGSEDCGLRVMAEFDPRHSDFHLEPPTIGTVNDLFSTRGSAKLDDSWNALGSTTTQDVDEHECQCDNPTCTCP